MKQVLDSELLSGAYEVRVGLRPLRLARCVRRLDEAKAAAVHLCQVWGGAGNPLIPLGNEGPREYLTEQLVRSEIDGIAKGEDADVSIRFLEERPAWDYPAALIVAHERREAGRPVEVVDLAPTDPWLLAYLGTLGWMPRLLDGALCTRSGLKSLDVNDVIPVEHLEVTGSLDDLLRRVSTYERLTPRQFSTLHLASGSSPNNGYMDVDRILPDRWQHATAAGPNIAVVMGPEEVEDFALLWNLRAHWGDSKSMPIGIPQEELNAETLRRLKEPGITFHFGWHGGNLHLVSETVPLQVLDASAKEVPAVEVVEPRDLVRFGAAPSRPHIDVQVWTDGATRVPAMTEADRVVLAATAHRRPSLKLSIDVPEAPLPAVGPLRGEFNLDYQCGMAQVQAESPYTETPEVHWPTGWTALSASALQFDLDVRESGPGISAMNLIRAVGGTAGIWYLCDVELIDLLYELAERSGMSWWKKRWERVERRLKEQGKSSEEIEALARDLARDEPVVASPNEGRQLAYSRFQNCFGRQDVTKRWLGWALERRILVQGVELVCPVCRTPVWMPIQQMRLPHTCPGCNRVVEQPFRPEVLTFTYRIGEVLRKCLEVDALGHVLALRWLTELFNGHGLVGAHPGVEFRRDGSVLGEVDVLMLFRDGSLVPVEVKRRANGFNRAAVAQLERISEEIEAKYDIMCVMESLEQCADLGKFERSLPARPRFLLTMDQLTAPQVFWPLGANPFASGSVDQSRPPVREQWLSGIASIGKMPDDWAELTVNQWRCGKGSPGSDG